MGADASVPAVAAPDTSPLLRPGLLDGVTVLAAPRTAATDACVELGADVTGLAADLLDEEATLAAAAHTDVLVVDGAALLGAGGPAALRDALDGTWSAIHAHFDADAGAKVVLVGPRPDAGEHAAALRAGYENLARVLSIEWSRHGIRITAILPAGATTDEDVAQVVAYLASPAGDYFSGTALELGA